MLISEAIKSRISELMNLNEIDSLHELALLAGIPYASIYDFFHDRTELIKIDKLVHICNAFHIDLKDFFDSPFFKDVTCKDI